MATHGPERPPKTIYGHHSQLVDAATGGKVNAETELVSHYIPGDSTATDKLLKDFTGIVKDAAACKLILDRDAAPFSPIIPSNCGMFITFQDLVSSQAIFSMGYH